MINSKCLLIAKITGFVVNLVGPLFTVNYIMGFIITTRYQVYLGWSCEHTEYIYIVDDFFKAVYLEFIFQTVELEYI